MLGVKPQALREAVEARWRSFSETGRGAPARAAKFSTWRDRIETGDIVAAGVIVCAIIAAVLLFILSRRN